MSVEYKGSICFQLNLNLPSTCLILARYIALRDMQKGNDRVLTNKELTVSPMIQGALYIN